MNWCFADSAMNAFFFYLVFISKIVRKNRFFADSCCEDPIFLVFTLEFVEQSFFVPPPKKLFMPSQSRYSGTGPGTRLFHV